MTIKTQIKFHELQALWWMQAATNGHATTDKVFSVGKDRFLTDNELRDRAMKISKNHMGIIYNFMEQG